MAADEDPYLPTILSGRCWVPTRAIGTVDPRRPCLQGSRQTRLPVRHTKLPITSMSSTMFYLFWHPPHRQSAGGAQSPCLALRRSGVWEGPKVPGHAVPNMPGHAVPNTVPKCRGTRCPKCRGTRCPKCRGTRCPTRSRSAGARGAQNAGARGAQNAGARGAQNAGARGAQTPGHAVPTAGARGAQKPGLAEPEAPEGRITPIRLVCPPYGAIYASGPRRKMPSRAGPATTCAASGSAPGLPGLQAHFATPRRRRRLRLPCRLARLDLLVEVAGHLFQTREHHERKGPHVHRYPS